MLRLRTPKMSMCQTRQRSWHPRTMANATRIFRAQLQPLMFKLDLACLVDYLSAISWIRLHSQLIYVTTGLRRRLSPLVVLTRKMTIPFTIFMNIDETQHLTLRRSFCPFSRCSHRGRRTSQGSKAKKATRLQVSAYCALRSICISN